MWYGILTLIILICLYVIYRVSKGKIRKVKKLNLETVSQEKTKEKQAEVKKRLIELKLEKRIVNFFQSILALLKTGGEKVKTIKFSRREKKEPIQVVNKKGSIQSESELQNRLFEAHGLLKKKELDQAEDKFIEVLEADSKNIEAYMGLGEIYGARQDWQTAEEAYRYIVKINPKFFDGYKKLADLFETAKKWDDLKKLGEEILSLGYEEVWVYVVLGLSYKKTGYPEKAEEYFKRAVEIEPQNEELLDYLMEVAIINKNKGLAKKALNTLSGICRDERKLQGYRDKVDIL